MNKIGGAVFILLQYGYTCNCMVSNTKIGKLTFCVENIEQRRKEQSLY